MIDAKSSKKTISIDVKRFLYMEKTNQQHIYIYRPKYIFCELKEGTFIFCRFMDQSIKIYNKNAFTQLLLNEITTAIVRRNDKEFFAGNQYGEISLWSVSEKEKSLWQGNNDNTLYIKLLLKIKSNLSSINSIFYNDRLNIISICDNKSCVIRKDKNFEYLTLIKTEEAKKTEETKKKKPIEKVIVDSQISCNDFIYIMSYLKDAEDNFEISGYSLNGIKFGSVCGHFNNFFTTNKGNLLCGFYDRYELNVYEGWSFKKLSFIPLMKDEALLLCNSYYFSFDKDTNIVYYGVTFDGNTYIKRQTLDKEQL